MKGIGYNWFYDTDSNFVSSFSRIQNLSEKCVCLWHLTILLASKCLSPYRLLKNVVSLYTLHNLIGKITKVGYIYTGMSQHTDFMCNNPFLSGLPLCLCPGWSNFTWKKAITMKCTHLYNHAIYFNQILHKLGKQSELSNYTGKIYEFWPTSWSRNPIWSAKSSFKMLNLECNWPSL